MRPLDFAKVDSAELQRLREAVENDIGTPAPTGQGGEGWETEEGLRDIKAMGYAGD